MTKLRLLQLPILTLVLGLVQSCGINSDLMLKTPKDYEFASLDSLRVRENSDQYVIRVDDILQFRFQVNNGTQILDMSAGTVDNGQGGAQAGMQMNAVTDIPYIINADSLVKLPALGYVNLVGKTIIEAEEYLQNAYKHLYVDPFVQVFVTNKRVLVFPGSGGDAMVVDLINNNTTLIEAIALAGGITERGRAKMIKLVREIDHQRKVFLIDLSTIDGLKHVDLIVQNGDYIYVEPVPQIGKEVLRDIAPIFSILASTGGLIFTVLRLTENQ